MTPTDFLATARRLLAGAPTDVDVRRAVSTVYYALFHLICRSFAEIVIRPSATAQVEIWRQTYRYPDHGAMKQKCASASAKQSTFQPQLQRFAASFIKLYEKRLTADYDPTAVMPIKDAHAILIEAQQAIFDFENASIEDQRAFVLFICVKPKTR